MKSITEDQVVAISNHLPDDWLVTYAMRYGHPRIDDAIQRIVSAGVTDLVVIPMMPHYAASITGTSLDQLYRSVSRSGSGLNLEVRSRWYDDAGYIEAQAMLIHRQITEHRLTPEDAFLLYLARWTPQAHIDRGDPYQAQVRYSVERINARLGWPSDRARLSFQYGLGWADRLKPTPAQAPSELVACGEKTAIVCPVGFTADCLESLEEAGGTVGHQSGRVRFCPTLNNFEPFMKALSVIARRGSHPAGRANPVPLLHHTVGEFDLHGAIEHLVMIGVCAAGHMTSAAEPGISHLPRGQFRRIKRPQSGALKLLREIHTREQFEECWLWNTCNRFEFYGLTRTDTYRDELRGAIADVTRVMFADAVDEPVSNMLRGVDAWRHLLYTATGLNSPLPGDTDVIEQLGAAFRLARHAGVAGAAAERLLAEIQAIVELVRTRTDWHRFGCGYCHAALNELVAALRPPWSECRCVVIGASTTSWSTLRTLVKHFGVPQEQLTVVYRGGGRHRMIKMLRHTVGRGRRVLVRNYASQPTYDAISEADVVLFGVDQADPIIRSRQLEALRRNATGPLTIVDFNTFGSTDGIDGIDGVHLVDSHQIEAHVDRFARRIVRNHEFQAAATAARSEIEAQIEKISHSSHRDPVRNTETGPPREAAELRSAATMSTGA